MPDTVYLLAITERHGDHHRLFRTPEKAAAALADYCREYWYENGPGVNKDEDEPDESVPDQEVTRRYYEACDDDEGATIEPVELED